MPKFGMRMRMPSALNRIAWYGRGKFENYPDRKITAIDRDRRDYEVELDNGLDLKFDLKFRLIDIDN